MPEVVLAIAAVLALILLIGWVCRTDFLLHVAGVDPQYIQTVPDRVRYTSMGAIVLLTATAATASLTTALFLVFPRHSWLGYLPVGLLWGTIVFNFDRWIVSSIDYGPLTAGEAERSQRSRSASKVVFFVVRFTMAALVGLVISEPIVLTIFGPEISQQLTVQHVADTSKQTAQLNAAEKQQAAVLKGPLNSARSALAAATRKATAEHKIYICELTGNCHLAPGEVTGIAGQGPQTAQDHAALQRDLRAENAAQKIFNEIQRERAKRRRCPAKADEREDRRGDAEDQRRQRPAGPRARARNPDPAEPGLPAAPPAGLAGADVHRPGAGAAEDLLPARPLRTAPAQCRRPGRAQRPGRGSGRQRSRKLETDHRPRA